MKINAYQKLAFYYDGIYNSKFYRQYAVFILKIIRRNRIINPAVLDCACGTGKLITELIKRGISKNNELSRT
jgi:ubiquinone/menaquinone biosynthesis C-methylase UbiE